MSDGRRQWSEVPEEEAHRYWRDPARRVSAPGKALVLTGCLGIMANLMLGLALDAARRDRAPAARPAGMDDATFQAYQRGRAAAPWFHWCLVAVPTLAVYPLVMTAGARMRQLRSRGLAMVGAVLAMAPCSPVMLVGLPVGVWSLIVLADPAVRAAFDGQRRRR
jgi:hypothetical protein